MAIVRYLEYRQFDQRRVVVNDAVMGLLAGSQLSSHFLGLTAGSKHRLADIFPHVEHIKRFNLRTGPARDILLNADAHLAAMAVPYVLSLHEDYMMHCLALLRDAGLLSNASYRQIRSDTMHSRFESVTGGQIAQESMELYHLYRLMRNCHIHAGGRASSGLASHLAGLSPSARNLWGSVTHEPLPSISVHDILRLTQAELAGLLAIVKRIAEDVNTILVQVYPRDKWADLLVVDAKTIHDIDKISHNERTKKVAGIARMHYGPLKFTTQEIEDAISRR